MVISNMTWINYAKLNKDQVMKATVWLMTARLFSISCTKCCYQTAFLIVLIENINSTAEKRSLKAQTDYMIVVVAERSEVSGTICT